MQIDTKRNETFAFSKNTISKITNYRYTKKRREREKKYKGTALRLVHRQTEIECDCKK